MKKNDNNEISNYESDNARNETFLEALQSLRPEVFEKLIEKLSFDKDTKFLSNKYEKLSSNKNNEFLSNENNEFLSNTDTKLSSKENNKLSSDANIELSSEEDNEHLFYMNDDKVYNINNCNKLYNELSYDEVINSNDKDENNGFSLEAFNLLLKENLSDIKLRMLSKGEISTLHHRCYVKTKLLLSHKDFKSNITQYLHANKFKITSKQFVKFVEDEAIPALGIEEKKTIFIRTAQILLHKQMTNLRPRMAVYKGDDMNQVIPPRLLPNISKIVSVTHNKLIFYANDKKKEANDLLPDNECLSYTDAYIIVYLGINQDGCWTNEDVIKQVSERATPIFKRTHPRKMNMKDGGKRLLLHNGRMCNGFIHIMIFVDQDNKVKLKGIKCVLQKHESFWRAAKQYACLHCDYSFKGLKKTVSHALESISFTKIHHFACQSDQYMSAYEHGLSGKAEFLLVGLH
ncbi:6339_t:CDS:2 [Cetraspora pellucida]|uniref:6339_t:CDS:1 n=1 Tax=Cetraspora pellucida TaxID=1433469 RepID=A0A9N8WI56_9GLOM|nr:6339_t:CDS:2 [Cetraspora pellucida]